MDEIILISDTDIDFLNDRLRSMMPQHIADAMAYAHVDADVYASGSGYFFKRQLAHIATRAYQAKVPTPNAFSFFSSDSEIQRGADSYIQYIEEPLGEAIIIANFADDLPRVNVTQREESKSIQWLGAAYGFSVKDIAAATFANKPLNQTLGITARKIVERKHNRLAWFGDYEAKLDGILTNADVPRVLFSNQFSAATAALTIEDEITAAINGVRILTKTTATITDIAFPPAEYAHIHSTSRSTDGNSNTSIAQYILMNNPSLERIHEAWELDADENGGTALMLGWNRDADSMRYEMVVAFEQQPAQRNGLEFVVDNLGITGGMNIPRPLEAFVGVLVRA